MAVEEDDGGCEIPEWVVTFGDMMSLLLTFFIMLVSLSEIKQEEQYQAMVESMRQQFGHDMTRASMMPGKAKPRNAQVAKLATMGRARKLDIMSGGAKAKAPQGDNPNQKLPRPGIRATNGIVLHFGEGEVELTEEHKRDLKIHAELIGCKPQKIEIRSHSSLKPASQKATKLGSNWEICFHRNKETLKYLVDTLNINPKRFRLSIAGSNEPVFRTEGAAKRGGQLYNPRVEVFLLDEDFHELDGTIEERQSQYEKPAAEKPAGSKK